ncbi:MAG TPA: hypothetical protein VIL17_01190 [Coriobacteriia bacterium]
MIRASRSIFVAVAVACLLGASATIATAQPTRTTPCLGACHAAGAGATVEASLVSTSATTATYDLTMTGAAGSAWALFDGSTKVKGATTTSDTFTVDLGKTYDIFAVNNVSPFNSATTSVSPAAPVVEPPTASLDELVPPVTTSDAKGSYVGTAIVKLTATDVAGQGVSYIYYSIDGARTHLFTVGVLAQTSVTVAAPLVGTGSHTITFWAQDKAGNVEAQNSAVFTVAAPPVAAKTATSLTMSISKNHAKLRVGYVLSGSISPAFAGAPIVITYRRPGSRTWRTWTTVQTNASGDFRIGTRAYHLGTYTYRVTFPGDATHGVARYVYDTIHIIR